MIRSKRITAILQAFFVTILWASSWVLIKIGLHDNLPALTFAGLRYSLAFVCLIPFVFLNQNNRNVLSSLSSAAWGRLALLGVIFYTLTQGSQFLSLVYLPAATVSLILGLTPVLVGAAGMGFLGEKPSIGQWLGIAMTIFGVGLYFLPAGFSNFQTIGLLIAVVGVVSNAAGSILGRNVNRDLTIPPVVITFVSMGVGAFLLLLIGGLIQGFGSLDSQSWLLIAWLAVVNTAFAFTLWNLTLQILTAVESSVINSLIMPQIAILAFVFLGEALNLQEVAGLILVGIGALIVQLKHKG
jgi:drug/metabolite transporter (DMT)-like permease